MGGRRVTGVTETERVVVMAMLDAFASTAFLFKFSGAVMSNVVWRLV